MLWLFLCIHLFLFSSVPVHDFVFAYVSGYLSICLPMPMPLSLSRLLSLSPFLLRPPSICLSQIVSLYLIVSSCSVSASAHLACLKVTPTTRRFRDEIGPADQRHATDHIPQDIPRKTSRWSNLRYRHAHIHTHLETHAGRGVAELQGHIGDPWPEPYCDLILLSCLHD